MPFPTNLPQHPSSSKRQRKGSAKEPKNENKRTLLIQPPSDSSRLCEDCNAPKSVGGPLVFSSKLRARGTRGSMTRGLEAGFSGWDPRRDGTGTRQAPRMIHGTGWMLSWSLSRSGEWRPWGHSQYLIVLVLWIILLECLGTSNGLSSISSRRSAVVIGDRLGETPGQRPRIWSSTLYVRNCIHWPSWMTTIRISIGYLSKEAQGQFLVRGIHYHGKTKD